MRQLRNSVALIVLFAFGVFGVGTFHVEAGKGKVGKDEVVRVAEKLIARNGCSDLLPVKRRKRLEMNNQDYKFALGHALNCKAFAVYPERPSDRSGWTVLFKLRYGGCPECDQSRNWRAVTMDIYGRDVRLEEGPFHPNPSSDLLVDKSQ